MAASSFPHEPVLSNAAHASARAALKQSSVCWTVTGQFGGYECETQVAEFSTVRDNPMFGPDAHYWTSLAQTYATYSLTWALSTGANYVLTAHMQVPTSTAWALTLAGTGVLNFYWLQSAFLPENTKLS